MSKKWHIAAYAVAGMAREITLGTAGYFMLDLFLRNGGQLAVTVLHQAFHAWALAVLALAIVNRQGIPAALPARLSAGPSQVVGWAHGRFVDQAAGPVRILQMAFGLARLAG